MRADMLFHDARRRPAGCLAKYGEAVLPIQIDALPLRIPARRKV